MKTLCNIIGCTTLIMLGNGCLAQERQSLTIEQALGHAAPPPSKVRTLGHEWMWELEQAGVLNRRLPRQYRIGLPLASMGQGGPTFIATYASPGTSGGNQDRRVMLLMHIPLD